MHALNRNLSRICECFWNKSIKNFYISISGHRWAWCDHSNFRYWTYWIL